MSQPMDVDDTGSVAYNPDVLVYLLYVITASTPFPRTFEQCRLLLQNNPGFAADVVEAYRKGTVDFSSILSHPILHKCPTPTPTPPPRDTKIDGAAIKATESSWIHDFKGNSAHVLLTTIRSHLQRQNVYSPSTVIVNSSGTGKSRMVDELAKTVVVVPMCLRKVSNGFPPPDAKLRDWLVQSDLGSQEQGAKRAQAVLFALFETTSARLKEIVDGSQTQTLSTVARQFRLKMTEGQSFKRHNDYREKFYDDVVKSATNFIDDAVEVKEQGGFTPPRFAIRERNQVDAWLDLHETISSFDDPLIVFAFDECHELTTPQGSDKYKWSMFTEIRRALRSTQSKGACFSLFLSTAGKFQAFSPSQHYDPSARVAEGWLQPLPPITETGFDQLAICAKEGELDLETVTGLKYMSHLGRPLFGSRWDGGEEGIRRKILDFARVKLLCANNSTVSNTAQSLACLAVRLALEFRPGTYKHLEIEMTQIERHMRICLGADPGFERMISVASSEPLLAEAAANVEIVNPAHELVSNLDTWGIDRGTRGELVAMLLLLRARDSACSVLRRRYLTVEEFMQALLSKAHHVSLASYSPSPSEQTSKRMKETFKNSTIWFNHFIKVHDYGLINVNYLWKIAARGAAILCADNQRGVDLVIPVLYSTRRLTSANMTAILIQVKNDKSFTTNLKPHIFGGMDPSELGLFPRPLNPLPVIRLVFALASERSGVAFDERQRQSQRLERAEDAYDIWVAGLSGDVFQDVNQTNIADYRTLIKPTPPVEKIYNDKDVGALRSNLRRQANPATQVDPVFFSNYLSL